MHAQDYVYKDDDSQLEKWGQNFTSRIGDGSGDHEQAYLDGLNLIFELKRGGDLLDVGSGFGRIIKLATGKFSRVVGLEPDFERFRACRDWYHNPPVCAIVQQTTGDYLRNNPGRRFDVVVISMVLQHLASDLCDELIGDAHSLVQPDGVVVIATTLTPDQARGFSYANASGADIYMSRQAYDAYASTPTRQVGGIPVRRFSRDELCALLEPKFNILHWEQFSYYRPDRIAGFATRLNISVNALKDVGDSQYVVLRKK